ncbi:hypothetical protein C8F04DRAFT_956956, partial [Mycena alexandri]
HGDLHKLFKHSERRTSESMCRIVTRAAKLNVTDQEELLESYGLHNFEHFLWTFRHSDPYAAACYDLLHYFDGGKWGRHTWVLIKEYLQSGGLASKFNDYMNQFPRWRGLKHISSPTTIDYSEGQTFVHDALGKDFNFLKQHSLSHAIEDFMSKGTSRNMNTRVGEGFQQEVEKMYQKTNGKNAEHQVSDYFSINSKYSLVGRID